VRKWGIDFFLLLLGYSKKGSSSFTATGWRVLGTEKGGRVLVLDEGQGRSLVASLRWLTIVALCVRCPQRKVVSEQLHYERRVFIRVLV